MLLLDGGERAEVSPSIEAISGVLDHAPASRGPFGEPVFCNRLVEDIGLDDDDNKNLTRRMLFLLEAVPLTAASVFSDARGRVLGRYLDESVKHYRPPRFLLNDVVRYWRTMCVDFAGKEHAGPAKWGIRNAKLRTSRKVLFAGGLLPVGLAEVGEVQAATREGVEPVPTSRRGAGLREVRQVTVEDFQLLLGPWRRDPRLVPVVRHHVLRLSHGGRPYARGRRHPALSVVRRKLLAVLLPCAVSSLCARSTGWTAMP